MSTEYAVSLEGVSKKLGAFEIGPLDLQLEAGYIYAVVGENGAGKSSLFSLIMNALKPDSGHLELFGLSYGTDEIAIKRRIGFASNHQFWEDSDLRTVGNAVKFISRWYDKWDEQLFWSMAGRLGLERSQKIRQLSTGFKQRLAIALALSQNPDLLLLDEATNGLDFQTTGLVHDELVRFMHDEGKTILLATHILDEIRRLADYIVFVHQGRMLGMFEKDALLGDWKMFWIDRLPDADPASIPGVVDIESNGGRAPIALVSSNAGATERWLSESGIRASRVQAMELQGILTSLISKKLK